MSENSVILVPGHLLPSSDLYRHINLVHVTLTAPYIEHKMMMMMMMTIGWRDGSVVKNSYCPM